MRFGKMNVLAILTVCWMTLGACQQTPDSIAPVEPVAVGKSARTNPEAHPTRYTNGLWYRLVNDKIAFEAGERCQASGVFVADCPADAVAVDLVGSHVIPALGDAHNHNVDGPWTNDRADAYLAHGVFYMRNLNSVISVDAWAGPAWESADTLDIAWAHAGISVDEGHPERLYRGLANVYRLDPESLDGDAFWDAPDIATLEARWPAILASRPDWIKLFLIFTEDEGTKPLSGLNKDVFARAVELAHAAGLRAVVHVNTAEDFATAIRLGADGAAHLPPTFIQDSEPADRYRITPEMAEAAARAGFITTPTFALVEAADRGAKPEDKSSLARARALQAENLQTLRAAGAPIALGSDLYDGDATHELRAVAARGVYSDVELLRIAVETPSNSIFPARAIGVLSPGWEASFLALSCDPSDDIACVSRLSRAVKQGVEVTLAGEEAS